VSPPQLALLLVCVACLAAGQLLFKLSARTLQAATGPADLLRLLTEPAFLLALVVYGGTTLLWVWILRKVPLTVAYPFVALSFVLVPLAGWALLGERVAWNYWAGIALIVAGIWVTSV